MSFTLHVYLVNLNSSTLRCLAVMEETVWIFSPPRSCLEVLEFHMMIFPYLIIHNETVLRGRTTMSSLSHSNLVELLWG